MGINISEHQRLAVEKLSNGNILCGGVGTGKSRAALAYYFIKECQGEINANSKEPYSPMKTPKDLYIITTARKRDTLEWEQECIPFLLSTNPELCVHDVTVKMDSWNNITKYKGVKDAFFIFDEQRVIGSGVWVKSFLKICKSNNWILLSATPGDTWLDYIPVFIANGFYETRTEFLRRHVIYAHHSKFPKVDRYIEIRRLIRLRDQIVVHMHYKKKTIAHEQNIYIPYDIENFKTVSKKRWNIYDQKPVKTAGELCYILRKVVNSDPRRLVEVRKLLSIHPKLIVFYNFNYELEMLLKFGEEIGVTTKQWNGHKHEPIPVGETWLYLVQYAAGSEGWNCVQTNAMIFFSPNYSYKATIQAAGRIDRMNTIFTDLYYYYFRTKSTIDHAIQKAFENKRDFNESNYCKNTSVTLA